MQRAGFLSRWTTTGPKRATATHAAAGSACTINIYYIDGREGRGVSAHIIKGSSKGAQASTPTSDDSDRKKPPRKESSVFADLAFDFGEACSKDSDRCRAKAFFEASYS